jgi:hypothetical protein
MRTKNQTSESNSVNWSEAKNLYVRLLHSFYERNEIAKSKSFALSLLRMIDSLDPLGKTLPGNEYRALIAEIDGDIEGAIHYREVLVKLIDKYARVKRLQDLALNPDEYADQLDLLAILYCQNGRLTEAEATIKKSERICLEAGILFDGKDVRKQIERAQKAENKSAIDNRINIKRKPNRKSLI